MRRFSLAVLLLPLALLAAHPEPAHAQFFGKNKVQYEPLDWAVLETPHLRVHYYAEEESLARRLTPFAESTCVAFDRRFRITARRQIPVMLYSTHHLFQQTNATPGLISEATGGLTELIKGRVLIPHNGSWARLLWVTRHELTHAYMLEKLSRVMREHKRAQGYFPPLWFTEGLAEYCGTTWDAEAEGLLRDAVLTHEAQPLTRSDAITGTVLMYKEGQSFLLYLAEHYGDRRIFDLLDNWYRGDDFESVFRITIGKKLEDVDREWFSETRKRYYPMVATHSSVRDVADPLTRKGHFNLGPRAVPNASLSDTTLRFCYFAASEAGTDLMLSDLDRRGRRRARRLLSGGASPQFESFHLFQNRPSVSAAGIIALSSKHGGRDAVYLVDARTRKVTRRLEFPHLVAVTNPSLVPGDSAVVFSAQDYGGRADLYRATWPAGRTRLQRLTDDDADDQEPAVTPDGAWVVFSSDRADSGNHALWRLPLAGGPVERLSAPAQGEDRQPVISPDGRWIAYRSTRGGTSDLWLRSLTPSDTVRRVTRLLGPALDPDWLPDGRGVLFTGQNGITFQTYRMTFDPDTLPVEVETPPALLASEAIEPAEVFTGEAQRYERRLGLDLVQNAFAVDPTFGGAGGGGQIALSDLLGNEQYYLYIANYSDRYNTKFWESFEGGVTYLNRSRRMSYGVGIFRLAELYDPDLDIQRIERRIGFMGLASYPFSKFTRVDGEILVRHASRHLLRSGEFRDVDLVSNFLTLVHDNSRWTWNGPSSGSRMFLSVGFTRDMNSGAGDNGTVVAEARRYYMPVSQLVLATRLQGQASFGPDAQRFHLGGPWTLPGYDPRTMAGLRTAVVRQEARFPVLRGLTLAFPVAWEFPTVSAAAFADMAWAWDAGGFQPLQFSDEELREIVRPDGMGVQGHLGSVGVGWFIGGGYFPAIRWNYAWTTPDFRHFSRHPRTEFSLGFNF